MEKRSKEMKTNISRYAEGVKKIIETEITVEKMALRIESFGTCSVIKERRKYEEIIIT